MTLGVVCLKNSLVASRCGRLACCRDKTFGRKTPQGSANLHQTDWKAEAPFDKREGKRNTKNDVFKKSPRLGYPQIIESPV